MGKPKYACDDCGRDYQSKAAADRHIRDKHNGNAKRIPYARLIADVKDGKPFEHVTGGLPSRVKRPDLGFAIVEELCREGARQFARQHLTLEFPDSWNVMALEKQLVSNVKILKDLVTTLIASGILDNFNYSTYQELKYDTDRIIERIAFLENKKRSDELKSQAMKDQVSKGEPGDENEPKIEMKQRTSLELFRESNESRARELKIDMSDDAIRERARTSMAANRKKWAQGSVTG